MALSAQQPGSSSSSCLYCARWNPPGAQRCANCGNLLPDLRAPVAGQPADQPASAQTAQVVALPGRAPGQSTTPGFYRSPARVFLFGLVAGPIYLVWWSFQLLSYEKHERFKNAGSPWALIVPIYGLVIIGRAFRNLAAAEQARLGRQSFSVAGVSAAYVALLIGQRLATNLTGVGGLCFDLGSSVVAGTIMLFVQRSANAYQAAVHPELAPTPTGLAGRVTWGEVVAIVLGAIVTLLLVSADLTQ